MPPRSPSPCPRTCVQAPASDLSRAVSETPRTRVAMPLPWRGASGRRGSNMPARPSPNRRRRTGERATRPSAGSACPGRALRVSLAAGFRIPIGSSSPALAGARRSRAWSGPASSRFQRRARAGRSVAHDRSQCASRASACLPRRAPGEFRAALRVARRDRAFRIHFVDAANGQRTAFVPFGSPDEFIPKERR